LELEVNKKAGDLSSVKVGDRITFSYDPDLEIVTRIGGDRDGNTGRLSLEAGCLLLTEVSDTGDVTVRLEKANAKAQEGNGAQGISRKRQTGGAWDCSYTFTEPEVLEAFDYVKGTSFNKQSCTARMVPPRQGEMATMSMRGRLHVPFTLGCEVLPGDTAGAFGINMTGGGGSSSFHHMTLQLREFRTSQEDVEITVFLREMNVATGQWSPTEKVFSERVSYRSPWTKAFRLPVPNQSREASYDVFLAAGVAPAELRRVTLRGLCSPVFGLQLQDQGDTVFVKKVIPEGSAIGAGLQDGDVISAVNGEKPKSMAEAMKLLAKTTFDEDCKLTVERGREKKVVTIIDRWDRAPKSIPGAQPGWEYLDDIQETDSSVGHGVIGKHGMHGYGGAVVVLGGRKQDHAISLHPPRKGRSFAIYEAKRQWKTFRATVGVSDAARQQAGSDLVFLVKGDGRVLWKSRPIQQKGDTETCAVDIADVESLTLEVRCTDDNGWAFAIWGEPQVKTK
jgi:hypothetical protein